MSFESGGKLLDMSAEETFERWTKATKGSDWEDKVFRCAVKAQHPWALAELEKRKAGNKVSVNDKLFAVEELLESAIAQLRNVREILLHG